MKKILLTIIDGLGDVNCKSLNGQTPLEAADTPNLDFLASQSVCGNLVAVPGDDHPTSEKAHFNIFGYSDYFPARGPLDALGLHIHLHEKDVAIRVNFATVDKNLKLIDPRAGRISSTGHLCSQISPMTIQGIKFFLYPSHSYRAVLVLRGEGISPEITSNDPHKSPPYKLNGKILKIKPKNRSRESKFTAEILELYTKKVHNFLEKHPQNQKRKMEGKPVANYLLLREPGQKINAPTFMEKYHLSSRCVAGGALYKGIARFMGMIAPDIESFTGDAKTNIEKKFQKAKDYLKEVDFVFLHIKAADIFAEDRDCWGKKNFIEKIDKASRIIITDKRFLKNTIVVFTGDHSTLCETGFHSGNPLPILIFDSKRKDKVKEFNEKACSKGKLKKIKGKDLMPLVLRAAK